MIAKTQAASQAAKAQTSLPDGWQMVRFGDVVRNVDVNERSPLENGLDRYIGLEHIEPDSLHIKTWGLVEEGTSFTRKFVQGQVLFGKRRAYQRKVAIAEFDGICSGDILVFEPANEQLIPELLPFLVQSEGFFQHALGTSAGSLSPRTRWRDLGEYTFPLPPTGEQRRIAEILWAADESIERWFASTQSIDELDGSTRQHIVCDEAYPRRPLGNCLTAIVAGKSVLGMNRPAGSHEFGVLKVSAVGQYGFVPDENKVLLDAEEFRSDLHVKTGDLLITRANTRELVGRVCLVPTSYSNLMLCDKTLRLEVAEDIASKEFVLEALRSPEARSQIEALASGTGGAMKNISQSDIRQIKIPLPSLEVQKQAVALVKSISMTRHLTRLHIENLRLVKASLLRETLMRSISQ